MSSSSTFAVGSSGHVTCVTTSASRATAPRGRTTSGLMSSSRDVAGEVEREALHLHDHVDERVDVGRLRAAHAFEQLGALRARAASRRASSSPNGGTRNVTSPSTSTKMPPSPTITTGPNSSSARRRRPSRRRRSPSRTRARRRCARLPAGLRAPAQQLVVRRRGPPWPTPTPTSHEPEVALVQQVGRRHLHHDRVADRVARPSPPAAADVHSTSFDGLDAVRREQLLRRALRQRLAGRRPVEQLARLRGRRRAARSARRRTASGSARRTPVVDVRLDRLHAVAERAEHRQAAVEQALVVRVVGARRRAPDHEDRLVGGLRDLDEVARERLAERRRPRR